MRFIPHFLWLSGGVVTLLAIAGYCGHSLPYLDPTPQFLADQAGRIQAVDVLAAMGVILIVAGIAWAIFVKGSPPRS